MGARLKEKPKALVAYWGYGDVDGDWYTKPSEHYRKTPLVEKDDAQAAFRSDFRDHTLVFTKDARAGHTIGFEVRDGEALERATEAHYDIAVFVVFPDKALVCNGAKIDV